MIYNTEKYPLYAKQETAKGGRPDIWASLQYPGERRMGKHDGQNGPIMHHKWTLAASPKGEVQTSDSTTYII
jgi:hypothetical protein